MSNLLERLRKYKDDRGMMANLRCIFMESKKHRAWPVLNRLGVQIADEVSAYVAGLYATHPEETDNGDFGTTCKTIEQKRNERQGDDSKLTPIERRFQHLLAADKEEVFGRVMRMVHMAKSQGVPVNYAQLEIDLKFWKRTKTKWAATFWHLDAKPVSGDGV